MPQRKRKGPFGWRDVKHEREKTLREGGEHPFASAQKKKTKNARPKEGILPGAGREKKGRIHFFGEGGGESEMKD